MKRLLDRGFLIVMALSVACVGAATDAGDAAYRQEIEQWRAKREERLKADGGWLTVAGLFWLHEGDNSVGSDPGSDVLLPEGSAPAKAGTIEFHGGKAVIAMDPAAGATVRGEPIGSMELKADTSGSPDVVSLGSLTFYVIQRGDRYGIRMKDLNSRFRKEFTRLGWFPVKESYRVTARFVPHDTPAEISVPNILGTVEKMPSPGYVEFAIDGRPQRLDPVIEDPADPVLFFIFKDATNGKETYAPGRFLYAEMPADGKVVLDFNKAYNPPCVFTPYATCPLPPEQNRLAIPIEAGELMYGKH